MVSRILSLVLIFLDPMMNNFTLMEVFKIVNLSIKGSKKMDTAEKIFEIMNFWERGELITMDIKQALRTCSCVLWIFLKVQKQKIRKLLAISKLLANF